MNNNLLMASVAEAIAIEGESKEEKKNKTR